LSFLRRHGIVFAVVMRSAHYDGFVRLAENRHEAHDFLAQPTLMAIAFGAAQLAGVRTFTGADDANTATACGAIEFDLEADDVGLRTHDCDSLSSALTSRAEVQRSSYERSKTLSMWRSACACAVSLSARPSRRSTKTLRGGRVVFMRSPT